MSIFDFLKKRSGIASKEPMHYDEQEHAVVRTADMNISVKAVASGEPFEKRLFLYVTKQFYSGERTTIDLGKTITVNLRRDRFNGTIDVIFSDISLLQSKGIIQSNKQLNPSFDYRKDFEGDEFATAEINNSFAAVNSGLEYITLFQITKQKGELISFMINNLPGVGDYYYLLILRENEIVAKTSDNEEISDDTEKENPARPKGLKITRADMRIEYKAYETCTEYPQKMRMAKKSGCLTPPFAFGDGAYRSFSCKDDCIFCHCPFYSLQLFEELRHNHRDDYDEWVMTYFKDFK